MEYFTKLGVLDLDGPITHSNTRHGTEATAACLEFVDFSPECAIGCAARERAVRQSLFVSNKPALAPILPRVYWGPPPS